MSEQSVRSLASLPTSLFASASQAQFGSCHSLVGSRKRKRFEVSAAIDGQTLNIYNIQTGRSITSYAVHPDTIFSCPASSIRVRSGARDAPVRYSVTAVKGVEFGLCCFQESIDERKNPLLETFTRVIKDTSPVVHVEIVPPSERDTEPEVVVVHRDGCVRRLTVDLQEVLLEGDGIASSDTGAESAEVVFVKWISKPDAGAGVLKDRADLRREHELSASSYLLLVSREGKGDSAVINSRIVELPTRSASQSLPRSQSGRQLKALLVRQLPNALRLHRPDCHINFHAPSARLSFANTNEVVEYDLSAYSLTEIAKFSRFGEYETPLFPMTDSMVAAMRPHFIDIYETVHSSVRVSHPLRRLKRSRSDTESEQNVRFIAYFQKLNSLVAVRGRNLIAVSILASQSLGLPSQRGVSLIEAIGSRAIHKSKVAPGTFIPNQPGISKILFPAASHSTWEASERILDELRRQKRISEFEQVMAKELRSDAAMKEGRPEDFSLPHQHQFVNPDKIRYLITQIFSVSENIEPGRDVNVQLAFFPPRLFAWLAEQGFLLGEEIGQALSTAACPRMQVKPGSIAGAILRQDPSLGLLQKYLQGSNVVTLEGVFAVVQLFIDDRISRGRIDLPLSPEEAGSKPDEGTQLPAANCEDTKIMPSAELWRQNAATVLNRALELLHRFSASNIVAAMREKLDAEQALFLIQYLRHELFQSGIISTSAETLANSKTCQSLAPPTTVALLGYCIDALGPVPMAGDPVHGPIWEAIVPDLHTEISLALHSINEANYLKGILREVVRYGQNATKPTLVKRKNQELGSAGRPVVVWDQDEERAMLPLDLRPHNGISRVKRRRGGGEIVQRSGRELLQLERQNVGSYSFERLVI